MDRDQLLEKHLNNELTEAEEKIFAELVEQDTEFAEAVEAATILRVDADMKRKQYWMELLETAEEESEADTDGKVIPMSPPQRKRPSYFSLAAVILVLIAASVATT